MNSSLYNLNVLKLEHDGTQKLKTPGGSFSPILLNPYDPLYFLAPCASHSASCADSAGLKLCAGMG
ncbi:MAG: hypothetical protein ACREO9_10130, partial [Lysobacterales bacterium]